MKAGTSVILTKIKDLTDGARETYPIDAWFDGVLLCDITEGRQIMLAVFSQSRLNPDESETLTRQRLLTTSPVVAIEGNVITTDYSVYRLDISTALEQAVSP